ncbi:MAG TPA: ABC transporter ATP-binding protein [Polyangiaceae bacterium]|nr:ABC transporter ATP-binding protein [Polyangiaceae bacterium]
MSTAKKKYLDIWQLGKSYPGPKGPAVIVKDFNLTMPEGEFTCLIGHSGCGKSTVLSILAGLNKLTEGTVILAGKEVTGPGIDRGVVFQSPCLLHWLTATENVVLGLEQSMPDKSKTEREKVARHYLQLVGLEGYETLKPNELSAGMRQRVGLARAFALSPRMLLLDEPFGMLDSLTRFELQQALMELWAQDQKTALMVTHDVDEALFLSDRVVMMTSGPAATIGEILEVPFPRPRDRAQVLNDPQYYVLRDRLIGFLEGQAHDRTAPETSMDAEGPPQRSPSLAPPPTLGQMDADTTQIRRLEASSLSLSDSTAAE